MRIVEVNKKIINKGSKLEIEEKIKKMKKEYERPVKGRFEFTEAQGGTFSFTDRQFPGMPIMQLEISHDEVCIIPYGIAKRLNNTYQKVRVQRSEISESGSVRGLPAAFEKRSRIKFIPEEFM